MKRQKSKIILGVMLCVTACLLLLLSGNIQLRIRQEKLARILGVRIGDYPSTYSFPSGYFSTTLKPGMTIDEVHRIITGYSKVLNCAKKSEIYYFYSTHDDDSQRIKIYYDEQHIFVDFEGEEYDSRTIQTLGCEVGRIEQ